MKQNETNRAEMLELGKKLLSNNPSKELQKLIHGLCPELAESEDERMTRAINNMLPFIPDEAYANNGVTKEDVLNWLEKQKEKIEKEYVFRPLAGTDIKIAAEQAIRRAMEGEHLVLAFNGMYIPVNEHDSVKSLVDEYVSYLEKQKEQKPAEYLDEDKVYAIMKKLTSLSFCVPLGSDEEKRIHEITCDVRSLLDYPIEQKPVEWGEEDDKMVLFWNMYYKHEVGDWSNKDVVEHLERFQEWFNNRFKSLRLQPHIVSKKTL